MFALSSGLDQRMGSNILRVTDREFMQKLQAKICEDHLKTQTDRIQQREVICPLLASACKQPWKVPSPSAFQCRANYNGRL